MAAKENLDCQDIVQCDLCGTPVSFYCRRCAVNLCDPCVLVHVRVKSEFGHDIIDFSSKDENDLCFCEAHPKYNCSAYCKSCDVVICILCISLKHRSHEITELSGDIELFKCFVNEKNRLRSFKLQLEPIFNHITKRLTSLSSLYQKRKDDVTTRGVMWHTLVDKTVKKLHKELDDMKKENKAELLKQKGDIEEMSGKTDEIIRKATKLQRSNNTMEMRAFRSVIEGQETIKEIKQCTYPSFCECMIDEDYLLTYFGYIEKIQERKILLPQMKLQFDIASHRKLLDVPVVSSTIDSSFPCDEKYKGSLYSIVVSGNKIWMAGYSNELKLFDLYGNLLRTVNIACHGLYMCMANEQVMFSDILNNAVKKVADDDTVMTILNLGDWLPYGITCNVSGDLLVCLLKDDQSKVVRYSSTGTLLQEIQYDSHCQPLYQWAWYIAENVNGDVVVSDFKKKMIIAVNSLGLNRYSYSGKKRSSDLTSIATDSVGHVIVADFNDNAIHMLNQDGKFLRYIVPSGKGIDKPRAVCMIGDDELIVGEYMTGLAKIIKLMEKQT